MEETLPTTTATGIIAAPQAAREARPLIFSFISSIETLGAMVAALCLSKKTSLDEWGSFEFGRAACAYSRARRFREWLRNPRIDPGFLLHPLTEHLISKAGKHVHIALDTSILFNAFCMVRVSLIFLDRAVPLVWSVRKSKSASVPFSAYRGLLEEVAAIIPSGTQPIFLADRGFQNASLFELLKQGGTLQYRTES